MRKADNPDFYDVPDCYWDLKMVFTKAQTTSLPPKRQSDCAIDLLPGAVIPKGRLYSLSAFEQKVIDECIAASLKSHIVQPSSSQAGAVFFFMEK